MSTERMNRSRRPIPAILALVACCLSASAPLSEAESRRIGVWNIERLSATGLRGFPELSGSERFPPRSAADLERVAEYIRDELRVDALMVSEIAADSPHSTSQVPRSAQLDAIAGHLGPSWRYFLGRTGDRMRLGFLMNTEKIRLKKLVNLTATEFDVSGRDVFDRDPFIAWVDFVEGGVVKNDVLLICVHLKSQQRRFRNNRMAAIAKLVGDYLDFEVRRDLTLPSRQEEPEVLILGDCNDSTFKDAGFNYMFDYLEGVGFSHVRNGGGTYPPTRVNGSQIDHIFASSRIMSETMVDGSFRVHTVPEGERDEYRRIFSDHFPVTLDLKVESDGDFSVNEALAIADPDERAAALAAFAQEPAEGDFGPAAVGSAEDLEEAEQDLGRIPTRAEVIDADFDRILSPPPGGGGEAGEIFLPEGLEASIAGFEDGGAGPAVGPPAGGDRQALWTAIDLIDREIRALADGRPLTGEQRARVEALSESRGALLRLLIGGSGR